ncbi:nucleoside triphosphatase YtkD [Halalkalibacterium halodurans]|uniref:7,8-dihydro-8-oxoguanine-triphosphatase n=1 Tax=Halalkalibacterium halodurans TaxID=86665 RepID=A0A0M0KHV6_ALKHA|nr:nucleoside triphosphatase YtkD [Halalkalibacterium halodurans]MED3648037.1 nucleoside triphosphatase YtkD [Halalkalibacterium halodurans]MED4163055.1 nucleoside triphosphatase YtkD [Halalkalibacterium halodurans]TES53718.1 nucleoside triphosphatase YtkD [Halalkalibacterium halodurans]TPE68625.1 nucleoside triphosphatase YtkD [Halalkalibacterium halodurans]
MDVFNDYYGYPVRLAFDSTPFSINPRHVWVICHMDGQWLLTNHKKRGLEFPGGKVEHGETPEAAAIREVKEETGATVRSLTFLGQYEVTLPSERIVKNIYAADVQVLSNRNSYYETNGPVKIAELPEAIEKDPSFSFIMKDLVLRKTLDYLKRKQLF